jgi:hypothetical protein
VVEHQVADQQHLAGRRRRRRHRLRVGHRQRQRLLDQHVLARRQRALGQRRVGRRRRRDDHRVDVARRQHLVDVPGQPRRRRHGVGSLARARRLVTHPRELGALGRRHHPHPRLSPRAGPDHREAHGHRGTRSDQNAARAPNISSWRV